MNRNDEDDSELGREKKLYYLCREIYKIYFPIWKVSLHNTIATSLLSRQRAPHLHSDGHPLNAFDGWPGTGGSMD